MSIPLVQEATKDAINTSIIAIKRNIERINMLLGLVDNDSPDLSGFATKQELQDAVTELQPVDEVTVGNMHSVTSNAVAKATEVILNQPLQLEAGFRCIEYVRYSKFGRLVIVDIGGLIKDTAGTGLWTTQLPIVRTRCVQQAFQDRYGANVYSACIYLTKDTTNGMGHFEGNIGYYANLVYLTD